jgi:hypothetical protein
MRSHAFFVFAGLLLLILSACSEQEKPAYTDPRPPREPYVPEYEPYPAIAPPIYLANMAPGTDELCIGFVFTNPANEQLIVSFVKEGEPNAYQICTGALQSSDKTAVLVPFGSEKEADILEAMKFYLTTFHSTAELIELFSSYPPTKYMSPRKRCAIEMLHAMTMNKKAQNPPKEAPASIP